VWDESIPTPLEDRDQRPIAGVADVFGDTLQVVRQGGCAERSSRDRVEERQVASMERVVSGRERGIQVRAEAGGARDPIGAEARSARGSLVSMWKRPRPDEPWRHLGGRQEPLEIADPIAPVAARVDPVIPQSPGVAPGADGVRMHAEHACRLGDGQGRIDRSGRQLRGHRDSWGRQRGGGTVKSTGRG
jgi:hypothetical protein